MARKRVVIALSHCVEEYDQLKLLSSLDYDVLSLGGYINPHAPHDPKRPALPNVPHFPELQQVVDNLGTDDNLGNAQAHIPGEILEWLGDTGIIIFHHYLSQRLFPQWDHLEPWIKRGGRVIWRTVGQSVEQNEREATSYRSRGLEIVRYSPREMHIPGFAGEDALIRFYKDPAEWMGYTGDDRVVTNVTQNLAGRHPWTNAEFYLRATEGLACKPGGPNSEVLPGGVGELELNAMKQLLVDSRVYLYTGTQPASYTLGLLEALMTGIPVISIGPSWMGIFPYGQHLFEGHLLGSGCSDDPRVARDILRGLLEDHALARQVGQHQRWRTIQEFGVEAVGAAWKEYLG